ncbi:MAG: efflux RND transporter periplasmic adaptor subunit [Peptococcaceae bacterium]|nr:efflux RND transporter periplasmic adaptor subunit [Peptococcaceae bacterium]
MEFAARVLNASAGFLKKKKLLIGAAVTVAVLAGGYFFLSGSKSASGDYLTDTVKRSTITSTISASGMIEPVSTVSLSFKNSEVIKGIYVKVGDHVTTGQVLAEQDSDNLAAQVSQASAGLKSAVSKLDLARSGARQEDIEQARANVEVARAAYDLAKSSLDRYQKLYQEGAVSKADLDKAGADCANAEGKLKQAQESLKALEAGNRPEDIAAAEAQVESSRAQLQMAQNDLAGARLVCPIDGIVSAINGAVGQRATANNNNTSGGGFITVISEALQVRAQVNEADIGRVQAGQKAEFTVNSFPNKTFTGRVNSISPQAYTVSNVQVYDIMIQPDEKFTELKAGMPANVNIIVDRREQALVIPKGAVTYAVSYLNKMNQTGSRRQEGTGEQRSGGSSRSDDQGQQATVLVLGRSGNPAPRRVVLGLSDLRSVEVVKGLEEGETVVVGSLNQPASGSQSSQSGQGANPPFMNTIRGAGAGGGRR